MLLNGRFPLSYLLIRIIRHPRYARSWFSQMCMEFDPKVTWLELCFWFCLVLGLQYQLLMPSSTCNVIFNTNYMLSLLLPVMLWGSMRYGFRFMSFVWSPLLILTIHYFYRSLSCVTSRDVQIAIISSRYLIFTFMILALAGIASRRRTVLSLTRRLASVDPMTHLPNLGALSCELANTPWSVLCFLHIPEFELLGRSYGVMFRIQFKQRLANWLKPLLQKGEAVHQLSGHDLVIRLNPHDWQTRIDELDARIKLFRFIWD
ncbi:MASE1 domain-containing protein [Kosakonia oryziphila]|nr:MASE1 domain-containing protein [Kosakonia oryziphila]